MLTFKDILQFPPQFAHREIPSREEVFLNYVTEEGQGFVFHFQVRRYVTAIYIEQRESHLPPRPDSKVKIYCSCPSFYYDFSAVLYMRGSLLWPEMLMDPWLQDYYLKMPPKKRNPMLIECGCKHVIAAARTITKPIQTYLTSTEVIRRRMEFQLRLQMKRIILSSMTLLRKVLRRGTLVKNLDFLRIIRR